MNRIHIQLAGAVAITLAVGIGVGYWFAQSREPARSPAAAGDRKVLYWHDPMVPGTRFDKPGKSPFMDMQLVPVYAEEAGGAAVRVNPTVTQNLGMRIGTVERKPLATRLSVVGTVAFDESAVEVVQSRVEGYVTRLYVKATLQHVRRGQPLVEILSPDWRAAQEEYVALLDAASERGRAVRDAARQRLSVLGVPEATIRDVETTRKVSATTTVVAPIDGVVTELSVREGAAFMPGAPLFRINGLATVWVNAQVPEAQVALVSIGSSVEARATAWPGVPLKGRVVALLPDLNAQTRTLPVRIVFANPDGKLAPGMFVSVQFVSQSREPQLVVPSEALIVTGERTVAVVVREGGGFDVAVVTAGRQVDDMTVVVAGLTEGQHVVLSGQFLIDSEASLKSTITRLSAPAESQP